MTNSTPPAPSASSMPSGLDPRVALTTVVAEVDRLIAGTATDQMGDRTPCPDFTVKELVEHLVLVLRRVATVGRGEHWASVTETAMAGGWLDAYRAAAADAERTWAAPDMLDDTYEVPWGVLPAVPVLLSYVAEMATHGWDLATATGQTITIDDAVLAPSLEVLRFGLPAEGRDDPDTPFDPVVDPGPEAPMVLRVAGWLGRRVA